MPEDMPDRMPEDLPDRMPEDMSDRMPEDLPVRKCINVMVGIIRSEVIFIREEWPFAEKRNLDQQPYLYTYVYPQLKLVNSNPSSIVTWFYPHIPVFW